MPNFIANYLIHTNSNNLDMLQLENSKIKIHEVKKVSGKRNRTSFFELKISFSATDNAEALRMAAINTDQSVLVFGSKSNLVNYHVELKEKRWLKNKLIEDQFFSC